MPSSYDGDINLKVGLDPTDVVKSSRRLSSAVGDIVKSFQGADVDSGVKKWLSGLSNIQAKAVATGKTVEENLGKQIATPEFTDLQKQLQLVEKEIDKTAAKLSTVGDKIQADLGITQMQDELAKLIQKRDELQRAFEVTGIKSPDLKQTEMLIAPLQAKLKDLREQFYKDYRIVSLENSLETANEKADELRQKMKVLQTEGKASTNWEDVSTRQGGGKETVQQLEEYNNQLRVGVERNRELAEAQAKNDPDVWARYSEAVRQFGAGAQEASRRIRRLVSNLLVLAGTGIKKGIDSITKGFKTMGKESSKSNVNIGKLLKRIFLLSIGVRSMFALLRRMRTGLINTYKEMMNAIPAVKEEVHELANSWKQFKNTTASVAQPLVAALAPALKYIIDLATRAANALAHFFAILTGQKFVYRAKAVDAFADSIGEAGSAAKEANKQLAQFDKLEVINSDKNSGGGGAGAGAEGAWEMEDAYSEAAEKVKDILSKLFDPIKKAWDKNGQYVMDAWKSALNNVWALIKDIGRDFLIMWQEDATVRIWEDIFHIIGDVGYIISNLARNLREAWNYNNTGLDMWRAIRDTIGVIIEHIHNMAEATKDWSDTLDFKPLMTSIKEWLQSLVDMADGVWGIFEDFYTTVLLPIGKFVIEEGLTEFFNIITAFNKSINWGKIRTNLQKLFKELEKIGKVAWKNLMNFIEKGLVPIGRWVMNKAIPQLADALADLANRIDWDKFLAGFERLYSAISKFVIGVGQGLINLISYLLSNQTVVSVIENLGNVLAYLVEHLTDLLPIISGIIGAIMAVDLAMTIISIAGALEALAAGIGLSATALLGPLGLVAGLGLLIGLLVGELATGAIEGARSIEEFNNALAEEEVERYGYSLDEMANKLRENHNALRERARATQDYVQNAGLPEAEMASALIERYKELAAVEEPTTQQRELMKNICQQLVDIYPELNGYISEETGLFDVQIETIEQTIDALKRKAQIEAAYEEYKEALKASNDGLRQVEEATRQVKDAEDNLNKAYEEFGKIEPYKKPLEDIAQLKKKLDDGKISQEKYNKKVEELRVEVEKSGGSWDEFIAFADRGAWAYEDAANRCEAARQKLVEAKALSDAVERDQRLLEKNVAWLEQLMGEGYAQAGESARAGLASTLDETVKTGEKIGTDTGDAMVDSLDTSLATGSPSREMEKRGKWANEGLKIGIEGSSNLAITAMTNTATKMVRAFDTSFRPMISVARQVMNSVIDICNMGMDRIANSINSTLSSMSSVASSQGVSTNFTRLSTTRIPRLAQGAVIPPNKEFLAMLGDQKRGTNIEAPLDTIVEAMGKAMAESELLQATMQQNELLRRLVAKDFTISSRDIFDAVGTENDQFIAQTGRTRFAY